MSGLTADQIWQQVEIICRSAIFQNQDRKRRLLRYLVEKALDQEPPPEATIAKDVFDKDESFNPAIDSLVRTTKARLSDLLIDFYKVAGPESPVEIYLVKGSYTPVFRKRFAGACADSEKEDLAKESRVVADRPAHSTLPPLVPNYLHRGNEIDALRQSLLATVGVPRTIALTAVAGMAGIGKTTLANALCRDLDVQRAFPDGVVWIHVGQHPIDDASSRKREVLRSLGEAVPDRQGLENRAHSAYP